MAGDAGRGLVRGEQRVCSRTMRFVAEAAILGDRHVLEDPWARIVLMAAAALFTGAAEADLLAAVRLVAVDTTEHALEDRVMRGKL